MPKNKQKPNRTIGQQVINALNKSLVADGLGGTVDLFTGVANAPLMLAGYLGKEAGLLDQPFDPIDPARVPFGSEWLGRKMDDLGVTYDDGDGTSALEGAVRVLGGFLGPMGAATAVAKAPSVARGALKLAENAAAPRTLHPQRGAIVWHGSPHKFDRFDASKIGTGEGAQAYGHGLYFAEHPDVAKNYAPRDFGYEDELMRLYKAAERRGDYASMDVLESAMLHQTPQELRASFGPGAESVVRQIERVPQTVGGLYKVDLPDPTIARMLDWDKPLSQQEPGVRAAVRGIVDAEELYKGKFAPRFIDPRTTGGEALGVLQEAFGGPPLAATYLRQAGIPGIRYLDEGSRGVGAGTSNFVVFPGEEGALTVLERNGRPLNYLLD